MLSDRECLFSDRGSQSAPRGPGRHSVTAECVLQDAMSAVPAAPKGGGAG